ncbi:Ribonuclease P protein subunit p40 [Penicillium rolfsii]|nr:Ribonuclease P protein subunit p40 [Penicillium rolfsii]
MFDFKDDASGREKCYTTVSQLPNFIDPKQVPSKKSPFSAIVNHPFVHTAEVLLPEDVYTDIQTSLDKLNKPQSARVFMSPSDLLEHEFFNTYIKTGNILMISEGRAGSDNVFTLQEGILKMELGREVYERTGLTGKPIRTGGRKHAKERFLVELNLRLPSMLHGKKGFDRIERAFKNVLNQSLAWLFCDLELTSGNYETEHIQKHHPQTIDPEVQTTKLGRISTPSLQGLLSNDISKGEIQERCGAFAEWIAMVQLGSPRVFADDDVDSYLSRYSVPEVDAVSTTDLISLKWHGLISAQWIQQLFLSLLGSRSRITSSKSRPASDWFVLSTSALGRQAVEGRDGYTIATAPALVVSKGKDAEASKSSNGYAICWEYVGATSLE